MTNKEKSVENEYPIFITPSTSYGKQSEEYKAFIQAIKTERQKREEAVEQAHMAGYYSCCKRDSSYSEARNYREALTKPNNK